MTDVINGTTIRMTGEYIPRVSLHNVICRTRLIVHVENSLSRQFLESEADFVKNNDNQIYFLGDTQRDFSGYKAIQEYITKAYWNNNITFAPIFENPHTPNECRVLDLVLRSLETRVKPIFLE